MRKFFASAFTTTYRWVLVGCVLLAGWLLWSGGIFDGQVASTIRSSSVYAEASYHLDTVAAQRVIGNRRLAVVFLDTSDGQVAARTCKDLHRVADGVLVVVVYHGDDGLKNYGCALYPDADDENFGKAYVSEVQIATGISGFADDPLTAVKVMAVKYDALAHADVAPQEARVIQASAPRYLLALIALAAVIIGSAVLYVISRRAGRAIADVTDESVATVDQLAAVNATMAGIAATILRVDGRYSAPANESASWLADYRRLAADYAALSAEITRSGGDHSSVDVLQQRADALAERADALTTERSTSG